MRKLLLCVLATLFLYGCINKTPETRGYSLWDDVNKYRGVCADKAFKETKAKLEEADKLAKAGKTSESNKAMVEAKDMYDRALKNYNDSQSSIDRYNTTLANHDSRMKTLATTTKGVADEEYTEGKRRVFTLHNNARKAIADCDVYAADMALNEAEREIRYLEDLVKSRANIVPATPVVTGSSDRYIVKRGDSLWKIASKEYNNPYFWPLIYWSNKDQIKDPDLIYPNQSLVIDRNQSNTVKDDADRFARTRGAWSLYDKK